MPVLAGAAAVSALALAVPPDEVNRMSVLVNFVFFLAGSRRPDLLRVPDRLDRRRLLPALAVGYAVLAALLAATGAPGPWDLLLSAVGVPAAVLGAVALSSRPAVAGPLAWLGRRTLAGLRPAHAGAGARPPHRDHAGRRDRSGLLLAVAGYPLLVTGLVASACLLLHGVLLRARLGFLFAAAPSPAPGRGRVSERPRRRTRLRSRPARRARPARRSPHRGAAAGCRPGGPPARSPSTVTANAAVWPCVRRASRPAMLEPRAYPTPVALASTVIAAPTRAGGTIRSPRREDADHVRRDREAEHERP